MKKIFLVLVFIVMAFNSFAVTGVDYVDLPFDMQNLITSLKNTINSTMQLYNQYQELANSVKQVKSWEQNLKGLGGSVGGKINGLNSNQMGLFRNNFSGSKGAFGNYGNIQSSFDNLYRGSSQLKGNEWVSHFQKLNDQITNSCNDALNMLQLAKDPESVLKTIQESQNQSSSADGAVKVGQAGNQLAAISAQEQVKQTALLAKLVQLEAEKQAKEADTERVRKQMNKDFAAGMSKQTKVKSVGLDVPTSGE